jgi:hypothetical protein
MAGFVAFHSTFPPPSCLNKQYTNNHGPGMLMLVGKLWACNQDETVNFISVLVLMSNARKTSLN